MMRRKRSPARKRRALKELHDFHDQNRSCGGLMDMRIIKRRDNTYWTVLAIFDEEIRRVVEALDAQLNRWSRESSGLLCLNCDNSVERLEDLEALCSLRATAELRARR